MPLRAVALAALPVLAGCAGAPPPKPAAAPAIEAAAVPSAVERATERRRAAALRFEQADELAGAAAQWQIVLLLSPGDRQAGERLGAVRAAIANIVREQLAAGGEALRRGDGESAQRSMLRVLAVDPRNEQATVALREIDRAAAMRRGAERAARAKIEPVAAAKALVSRRGTSDAHEFDLEQSLELLQAGDAQVALAELRRYVLNHADDRATRERIAAAVRARARQLERQGSLETAVGLYAEAIGMHASPPREWSTQLAQLRSRLADEQYEKGVRAMAGEVSAAIAHFEAALRYVADHAQAKLRLEQARRIAGKPSPTGPARD